MEALYEVLPPTDSFQESLQYYFPSKKIQDKIMEKIKEMLPIRPCHYDMLHGKIKIKGVYLVGLRHMKVGVEGIKGGAVVYYRVCEECKENGYDQISEVRCEFCDDEKGKHIALFLVRPRAHGY